MSREVAVMQRHIKVEMHSPVKPEVLKPSNTPNIRGIGKAPMTSKAVINTLGKITSTSVSRLTHSLSTRGTGIKANQKLHTTSPRSTLTTSSSLAVKSPLKPLLAIRPSPTNKVSLTATRLAPRSPLTLNNLVRTPSGGSSALSTSTTSPSSASTPSSSPVKCRRRINYSESDAPIPVSRRNARERNRVKQVSSGFALLRQHVPQAARKKKMSKVETLRCAVDYIRGLQLLLDSEPQPQIPRPPPVSTVHSFHNHHHHHHHHQQLQQQQTQVFLQPPHTIEPHILKLPVADETFQSPASLRYDSATGTFFRTSPTDSESSQSPAHTFLDKHQSPVNATPSPALGVGVIKTENNEGRSYTGREEQDLLEALAWWQHNIQQ